MESESEKQTNKKLREHTVSVCDRLGMPPGGRATAVERQRAAFDC